LYHLRQALSGIRRAGFMSVACVIIMTFSLLIFGIFLFATANLRELLRYAHQKVEIVVFFEDGVAETIVDSIMADLDANPVVEAIRYVGPDEALERLKGEFGAKSHLLDQLETNPLPSSLEITLKPRYRFKEAVEDLAGEIAQKPGVEDVSYGKGWIARLERIVRALALLDIGVGLVVAIAAVVTVSYTVRLTIYARRDVIRVLKMVGATDSFVMAPFLIEGAIHGLAAVLLALLLLFIGYKVVDLRVPQVVFLPGGMALVFAVFGIVIAVLGSLLSLRAFLGEKGQS
jgi:cell division transport system permease protein